MFLVIKYRYSVPLSWSSLLDYLFNGLLLLFREVITLSVEKIPVVLRPVIKLPVKSMTSIETHEEIRRKAEI